MQNITLENFLELYKLKAFGINAVNRCNLKFPIIPNENLVRMVSYLTFDGHLSLKQHCFLYTGKDENSIQPFRKLIMKIFKIDGVLRFKNDGSFGPSCEFRVFNNPITKLLYLAGAPSGNKTLQRFDMPNWISQNKEFTRFYLQVAFDCEGSIWKGKDGRIGINFTMAKEESILDDAINFLTMMQKLLLDYFGIKSGKITIIDGNTRKDGKRTKFLRFKISTDSLKKFKREIGFISYIKNNKLNLYVN